MSLGFHMTGRISQIEKQTETVQTFAKEHGYGFGMGNLEVVWSEDAKRPGQWLVDVDCQTTPAGPGFHKAALELAERLGIGEPGIDDETDYVNHRDFEKTCGAHNVGTDMPENIFGKG